MKSLSEGNHSFDFKLDNKYFSDIGDGESDIKKGDVEVKLTIKRVSSTFELNFDLKGEVIVSCDRCLDNLPIEIATGNRLFVKFGKEYSEESDEIVVIPETDGELNIAWFLYEFVSLSIPMKKVHAPGKCNKLVSSKLNKHRATVSGDDSDEDGGEIAVDDEEVFDDTLGNESENDPRWNALKGINLED